MDVKELENKWRSLYNEQEALTTPPDDFDEPEAWQMSEEASARFDQVEAEIEAVEGQIATLKRRKAVIGRATAVEAGDSSETVRNDPGFNFSMNRDPYDTSTIQLDADLPSLRGRVETGLERDGVTPDPTKEQAMRTLARVSGDKMAVAKRFLATGSTSYRSRASISSAARLAPLPGG